MGANGPSLLLATCPLGTFKKKREFYLALSFGLIIIPENDLSRTRRDNKTKEKKRKMTFILNPDVCSILQPQAIKKKGLLGGGNPRRTSPVHTSVHIVRVYRRAGRSQSFPHFFFLLFITSEKDRRDKEM